MEKCSNSNSRRPGLASVFLILFACIGCVPDVAWLPDSSGIVYTVTEWPKKTDLEIPAPQNGRLFHYDLASKTSRLLVAKTEIRTIQPAMSPDGKRIGVAHLSQKEGHFPTLQVVVYDLQGKEVHRSKTFIWGDKQKDDVNEPYSQLFWKPRGNKILVHANGCTF